MLKDFNVIQIVFI